MIYHLIYSSFHIFSMAAILNFKMATNEQVCMDGRVIFFFIWLSSTICQKEFPVLSFYRIFPHSHDTNSVLATTLEFENKEYLLHFHLNPKGRTMDYHYQAKLLILNTLMHLFLWERLLSQYGTFLAHSGLVGVYWEMIYLALVVELIICPLLCFKR